MVEVFEPFESADSFGATRISWDATLLEGVLTHLWDGGIHSSLLLNPQMILDFGQALLGCHSVRGCPYPSVGWGDSLFFPPKSTDDIGLRSASAGMPLR